MSQALLGELFDIHGGGCDLVFPHHENERAISRSFAGSDLARYWLHHGLVTANGSKLSRSIDAPVLIRDLCRRYHPEAVRLFLLSTHYRRPLDFSDHQLSSAAFALDRLYGFLHRCEGLAAGGNSRDDFSGDSFQAGFCRAVDEDFNIPEGLSLLFSSIRQINRQMNHDGRERLCESEKIRASEIVLICRRVLGIFGDSPEQYMKKRQDTSLSSPLAVIERASTDSE